MFDYIREGKIIGGVQRGSTVMKSVKVILKQTIKETDFYQGKKEKKFYLERKNMLANLPETERNNNLRHVYYKGNKSSQFVKLFSAIEISILPEERFQTWIDTGLYFSHLYAMTDNQPPDYGIIIHNSIKDLQNMWLSGDSPMSRDMGRVLSGIESYINRVVQTLQGFIDEDPNGSYNLRRTLLYFENMKDKRCEGLEEGLQRILFWSSIFWQTQHRLVGIGRLDKILAGLEYSEDSLESMIEDFYRSIHRYFAYKSNGALMGDTGQIIELGGLERDGTYFVNDLTYGFIRVMKKHPLPDPKILLRVSRNMPDDLLILAVACIATGIGCPLLSNDDIVIPALEAFGYSHDDACNYVTSACWEPLAYGKSLEKNNMSFVNYGKVFESTYKDSVFETIKSFDDLLELFFMKLQDHTKKIIEKVDATIWEPDPLLSLFTEGCRRKQKDISEGGAIYNNYGILTVGLANAIDSLLNIKRFVFESGDYSLREIKDALETDFINDKELKKKCMIRHHFGHDAPEVISLVRNVTDFTYEQLSTYRNKFGGKLKWGLSASNYVETGEETGTTLDGREKGDPLAVHISAPGGVAYTEVVNFASSLDYSGQRANGNVIDLFVTPELITGNVKKFVLFIKGSIRAGFFQMQMNVVKSRTLIAARKDPDAFPELIVRVWGFSAYFKDLPETYKDILIKRALECEKCVLN